MLSDSRRKSSGQRAQARQQAQLQQVQDESLSNFLEQQELESVGIRHETFGPVFEPETLDSEQTQSPEIRHLPFHEGPQSAAQSTEVTPGLDSNIDELRLTAQFIEALKSATLEKSNMDPEDIKRLREAPPHPLVDTSDRHFIKALRTFIATINASEETYNGVRAAQKACYPDDPFLSFYQIKRQVEIITGVSPIFHDMCVNSCVGFTGPLDLLDTCLKCKEPRYHAGTIKGCRQFLTIPIGSVLQAFYRSDETAGLMHYLEEISEQILQQAAKNGGKLLEYNDTACGMEHLNAWMTKKFRKGDISLQLSIDGAQLYRDKESDCWIFIWIIHNLSPKFRKTKKL
ncbi:hypothetical protein C0992_005782 [Termitomyces sp. T32_za158]|nr:hypothetical protein C0992_005782 [Termitomyces sp. T32_za158]